MWELPKTTEKELQQRDRFFAEGEAYFEVVNIEPSISSTNLPMLVFSLHITDCLDRKGKSKDWFVAHEKMKFKVLEFLHAVCSSEQEYKEAKALFLDGKFNYVNYIGATGKCNLFYRTDKETRKERLNIAYLPVDFSSSVNTSVYDFDDDLTL